MFKVAIDGPAGAGKSTIAKNVAKELSFDYIDTGAIYRTIALKLKQLNVDTETIKDFSFLDNINLEIKNNIMYLDNKDVSKEIRTEEITKITPKVASYEQIRTKLLDFQRNISKNNFLMDGRDIGSVVLPDADLKIFLTASVDVRAKRRYNDYVNNGEIIDLDKIKKEIELRDHADMTREISPLVCPGDAIIIDTSDINIQQVTKKIVELVNERGNINGK